MEVNWFYCFQIAEYAELALVPSYFEIGKDNFVHGVNFASGGAGCLDETFRGFVSHIFILILPCNTNSNNIRVIKDE